MNGNTRDLVSPSHGMGPGKWCQTRERRSEPPVQRIYDCIRVDAHSKDCATSEPSRENARQTWPESCVLFTATAEGEGPHLNRPQAKSNESRRPTGHVTSPTHKCPSPQVSKLLRVVRAEAECQSELSDKFASGKLSDKQCVSRQCNGIVTLSASIALGTSHHDQRRRATSRFHDWRTYEPHRQQRPSQPKECREFLSRVSVSRGTRPQQAMGDTTVVGDPYEVLPGELGIVTTRYPVEVWYVAQYSSRCRLGHLHVAGDGHGVP